MTHGRARDSEPHPFKEGRTIRCCYMNATDHPEYLVFIEGGSVGYQRANRRPITYGLVRHNSEPPLGDGETGGNVACCSMTRLE